MKLQLLFAGVVVLLAGCGCARQTDAPASQAADGSQWMEFASPEGRFAALFPVLPTDSIDTIPTLAGPVAQREFRARMTQAETRGIYNLAFFDVPTGASTTFLQEEWQRVHGTVAGSGLISKRDTLWEGNAIIEYQYWGKGSKTIMFGKMIQVGSRIYDVFALLPRRRQTSGDAEKFLASFRLLK